MILVTGANGMLGNAVVEQLLDAGERVRTFDLAAHANPAVESVVGDIRNIADVRQACANISGVIHTASLVDLHLGQPQRLHDINVGGVKNLIAACREHGIQRLSYMSSAEVISGADPLQDATEHTPYPRPHLTYYGVTKEAAEQQVLAANDAELATCAMRTFGIFGERDRNFIQRAIDKTNGKQLPAISGTTGITDVIYAGNIAHALILGLSKLAPGNEIGGQTFHITDHAPQAMQSFLAELLRPLGYQRPKRSTPLTIVWGIAALLEALYTITKLERFANPIVTRHQLLLSTQDYYLDSSKARDLLGYTPRFSRAEAIKRTQDWFALALSA